jgi:hypothetical protein
VTDDDITPNKGPSSPIFINVAAEVKKLKPDASDRSVLKQVTGIN